MQSLLKRVRNRRVGCPNYLEGATPSHPIVSLTILNRLLGPVPTDWDGLFTQTYDEAAAAQQQAGEDAAAARTPGAQPAHPLDAYAGE